MTESEKSEPQLEIERKWLVPASTAVLGVNGREHVVWRIEQIYLADDGEWHDRVRRVKLEDGSERYFRTRKRRLSALVREEDEREISAAEYERLCERADGDFEPLVKTRLIFDYDGHRWELDLFDRYPGDAILEVELEREDDEVSPPAFLGPAIEVTPDRRFSSRALTRKGARFPRP